jgi:hypothetical protein
MVSTASRRLWNSCKSDEESIVSEFDEECAK